MLKVIASISAMLSGVAFCRRQTMENENKTALNTERRISRRRLRQTFSRNLKRFPLLSGKCLSCMSHDERLEEKLDESFGKEWEKESLSSE